MAAGRPVVATRCGALPEVGRTAAYYGEVRDPPSFATALSAALDGEDWSRRLEEARAIVAEHTWHRTATLTLAAYREAVASPAEVGAVR
jgi:glycosyltransferase involved in cell wall biosynthesis